MATYSELLKDPRWQRKRLEILNRDGFRCQSCMDDENTLHIHHTKYGNGMPWEVPNDWLVTLCECCHKREEDLKSADLYKDLAECGLTRRNIELLVQHVSFLMKKNRSDYTNSFWTFHNEVLKKLVLNDEVSEYCDFVMKGILPERELQDNG